MAAKIDLEEFCRLIPKVEIHCHLLGTIRRQTMLELNHRAGSPLPVSEIEGFYIRGDRPKGVLHIFRALDAKLIKTPDDLYRITFEYLQDAHAHTVRYTEFFWNPTGTVERSGVPFEQAQGAIQAAIDEAELRLGIVARLIPSIDREAPPAKATEMVEMMLAHPHEHTIGIGIDYREPDGPPGDFAEAFALARAHGYKTTAHAGEFGMPAANVKIALDNLKVDRIDHGYTIVDDPDLARICAGKGIIFTVVPTNSYYLRTLPKDRWALDHPMRRMPDLGLRIHPNTDDPAFHLVTPTGVWAMMVQDFGFDLDHLRQFMINGLDGAWLPEGLRARMKRDWCAEYDVLRARLIAFA
ncbi:Adenosine deaminase [hydrothermal vent metagenome]|uniref:Adenosine deaminase n=1 Tax=hydrothermal vent metagenome TaxID=652676 RepID=A0A3B0TFY2_9ZZZZ